MKISNEYRLLLELLESCLTADLEKLELASALKTPMIYSLKSGGKRLRPVLTLAFAELLGLPLEKVYSCALAAEYIHTSSLIHDDLPMLDNDSTRRGQPTCHVAFGEANALLAADALIGFAFLRLVDSPEIEAEVKTSWVRLFSQTYLDLCEGQILDLGFDNTSTDPLVALKLRDLKKTASLFRAAICSPLFLLSKAEQDQLWPQLERFSLDFGLLFQITDDILDFHVDLKAEEGNYVRLLGRDKVEQLVQECTSSTTVILSQWGQKTQWLQDVIVSTADRGKRLVE